MKFGLRSIPPTVRHHLKADMRHVRSKRLTNCGSKRRNSMNTDEQDGGGGGMTRIVLVIDVNQDEAE